MLRGICIDPALCNFSVFWEVPEETDTKVAALPVEAKPTPRCQCLRHSPTGRVPGRRSNQVQWQSLVSGHWFGSYGPTL